MSNVSVKADVFSPETRSAFAQGVRDLVEGSRSWRLSYMLGTSEVRRRYARSRLGQFWVTASMGIMVTAMGLVWAQLWKTPVNELLPFVAVSLVFWTFFSGVLTDSTGVFVAASPIMHNQGLNFSTIVYGMLVKNIVILAHNLPVVAVTMLVFAVAPTAAFPLALIGFVLMLVFGAGLAYVISIVCLRFRDLAQVIQNGVTVLFFVTPVLWRPEQLAADKHALIFANPVATFLGLIQKPLLGQYPEPIEWAFAVGYAVVMAVIAVPIIGMTRKRLIYWL